MTNLEADLNRIRAMRADAVTEAQYEAARAAQYMTTDRLVTAHMDNCAFLVGKKAGHYANIVIALELALVALTFANCIVNFER